EYARHVARLSGVDLQTVEDAMGSRRSGGRQERQETVNRPFDRYRAELLRVALPQPGPGLELEPSDLTGTRLRRTSAAVGGDPRSGTSAAVSTIGHEGVRTVARSPVRDRRPPPSVEELAASLSRPRPETRREGLYENLATLAPSGQ